jgi:alanine racemase
MNLLLNLARILSRIERAIHPSHPLIEVSISRENLLHNLHSYQKQYPELTFAPVLKSNAYGHGLVVIARLLDRENIAFFMVDSLYEARTLRQSGIHTKILVLGYVRPEDIAENRLRNVDFGITDIEQLRSLATLAAKPIRCHLKIDTGMHRQGILPGDITEAIRLAKSNPQLEVIGIGSHFADADGADSKHTDDQTAVWNTVLPQLIEAFPTLEYRHVAATKGMRWSNEAGTNVARLGIGLYGFDTSHAAHEGGATLRPVLQMRSFITSLRSVPAGDFVGYNATYVTQKPSTIATVPVGYFEGIDRTLSGVGGMLVRGQRAPLAGRVSMNMSSLDVTDIPSAVRGDTVIAISRNPSDQNSVEQMATLAGTTPYVILVHIPQHLKRVVE